MVNRDMERNYHNNQKFSVIERIERNYRNYHKLISEEIKLLIKWIITRIMGISVGVTINEEEMIKKRFA